LISAQQALLTSQISLYKTLGGGWQNSSSAAE
jgi:outer membrane protein TolC